MKKLVVLFLMLLFSMASFPQALETVGSGVIDFLLANPKTANRMNSTDRAALNTIGNLLYTAGQRKHEMNVANAGKQQIILQETSGKQVTFVIDPTGKHYIVYQGIAYPIEQEIIHQAEEEFKPKLQIRNEFLPPYDLEKVRSTFYFDIPRNYGESGTFSYTVFEEDGEYLSEIIKKLNISRSDISMPYYQGNDKKGYREIFIEGLKAKKGTRFLYTIKKYELPSKIAFMFTCKWVKDFDENGYDFEDFQGVKNSFLPDEDILIVGGYQTDCKGCNYILEIFDGENGSTLFRRANEVKPGTEIIQENISSGVLIPGIYIYNFKLQKDNEIISSKKDRFEIRNQ